MFNGYLVRLGTYTIPLKYMEYGSYKMKENTQDLRSERNTAGYLIRDTLEHKPYKFEFNFIAGLTNNEISVIFNSIRQQFEIPKERKCLVSAYFPEIDDYIEQEMYIPDIDYTIDDIEDNVITYESIRVAGVGY